ncbi:MAG TPA: response regulator transcription factor [Terriglobales bacterium]|nr:response regulator transcription factor [Terriglobales bacterium]
MRQTILVVEGKTDVCQLVGHCLERAGYAVQKFSSTADVISEAEYVCPALIIISLSLPGRVGLQLCRSIRRISSLVRTPIVFLAGTGSEVDDCLIGLESGGNDYIPVPFNPREMVARIQAVLRRSERFRAAAPPASVIKIGDIEIDRTAMKIFIGENEVFPTTLEFRLVDYLARNQHRVFNRDELLDAVWGETQFVTPRSVDACIRRIRRKIEPDRARPTYLKTIRGVGYRFDPASSVPSATISLPKPGAASAINDAVVPDRLAS